MSISPLASLLIGSGAVSREKIALAQSRRTVYGGTLDTILLELGALDERTLTAHLAEATGLPAPLPERLASPGLEARGTMPAEDARRLSVAPLGRRDGVLELALHPEADVDAITAWADTAGLRIACFVVPEVRYRELMAAVYGDVIAPRFVSVLARLMGAVGARQRSGPVPAVTPPPRPLVDTMATSARPRPRPVQPIAVPAAVIIRPEPPPQPVAPQPEPEPEPDIEITEDFAPPGSPDELLDEARSPDPEIAARAFATLADRREVEAVPLLIARLADEEVAEAAQEALVVLTGQEFAPAMRPWLAWWQKARQHSRIDWLFEALSHKRPDRRLAASEELRNITGVYFGYHFDLPARDREEARRRWSAWWHATGKATAGGGR
jgi:hypothetical protein